MFSKKVKCFNCSRSFSREYKFCPFCSAPNEKTRKYKSPEEAMLKDIEKSMKMPFFLKLPMKGMIKELTKQMYELEKQTEPQQGQERPNIMRQGFAINISSMDGKPVVRINQLGAPNKQIKEKKPIIEKITDFSKKDAEQFSALPKKEPKTSVRRLSNTVIYELEIPKAEKDKIIINHLENSIEIKALTKEKAYFKVIPVSLPIKSWNINQDVLTLELEPE
jgi:hypothetical protein